ncbi:hypothetical protein BJ170DRAFT_645814 [Xylariales sp. AK1849]|nr:hypothetical protein BJ170DRAFT_645814 [Xylariales sp. AK1849]
MHMFFPTLMVPLLLTTLGFTILPVTCQGINLTCWDFGLDAYTAPPSQQLEAKCDGNTDGAVPLGPGNIHPWNCTRLDLNLCYGYDEDAREIVPMKGGNLGDSCFNCVHDSKFKPWILECECVINHHLSTKMNITVDTNELLVNDAGLLRCFDHHGDPCLHYAGGTGSSPS